MYNFNYITPKLAKALQVAPALVFFITFRVYESIIVATQGLLISVIVTSALIALMGKFNRINALILLGALCFCLPTIYLAVLLPLPTFADTCTEAETSFKRVTVSFRYSDGIPTR